MDFIVGLPKIQVSHDTIWVIVDQFIKSSHCLDIKMTDSLDKLARTYIKKIVKLHGISIVSYRDPKFTSKVWKSFQQIIKTKLSFNATFHPQTYGQYNRTISTLEDILRACVLDIGGHWDDYMPLIEFAYNNIY